jgi:hypothetical protein
LAIDALKILMKITGVKEAFEPLFFNQKNV